MKILIIDTNALFAFFSRKRFVEIFKKLYFEWGEIDCFTVCYGRAR
jgi:hypothetical protein